jgi:hypothetical protein
MRLRRAPSIEIVRTSCAALIFPAQIAFHRSASVISSLLSSNRSPHFEHTITPRHSMNALAGRPHALHLNFVINASGRARWSLSQSVTDLASKSHTTITRMLPDVAVEKSRLAPTIALHAAD